MADYYKDYKKKPIVIKLNPNKEIGYRVVNVGPGGKETVVREKNFVIPWLGTNINSNQKGITPQLAIK